MNWHSESISLEGAHAHVAVARRDGPAAVVLFLHGLGCSKDSFAAAWGVEALEDYLLVAPDLVGFGDSSDPPGFPYRMEDQARICDALVERLPRRPLHVVAHSMGCAVALLMMACREGRLASFVCAEGNLVAEDCSRISRRAIRVPFDRFQSQYFPMIRAQSAAEHPPRTAIDRTTARALYGSCRSLVSWSDSGKLLASFLALSCPRICLYGDRGDAPQAVRGIDGIEVRPVAEAGHFLMNDNPEAFYGALSAFLADAAGASPCERVRKESVPHWRP